MANLRMTKSVVRLQGVKPSSEAPRRSSRRGVEKEEIISQEIYGKKVRKNKVEDNQIWLTASLWQLTGLKPGATRSRCHP